MTSAPKIESMMELVDGYAGAVGESMGPNWADEYYTRNREFLRKCVEDALRAERARTDAAASLPQPTGIEALVCAEIAQRQMLGIAKYGQTVADNPLTLRQWLQHALEECCDQAVYLRRAIAEIDGQSTRGLAASSRRCDA